MNTATTPNFGEGKVYYGKAFVKDKAHGNTRSYGTIRSALSAGDQNP
jgi:hypothetical protein